MPKKPLRRPIRTKIVGVTFKNDDGTSRQDIIKRCCKAGTRLAARHEPKNPYDSNAISLWVKDGGVLRQVGHLKRELAADVVRVYHEGGSLRVVVLQTTGGGWLRNRGVNVVVEPVYPDDAAAEPTKAVELAMMTAKRFAPPAIRWLLWLLRRKGS